LLAGSREYEVRGEGFDPQGEVRAGATAVRADDQPGLRRLLECAVLCNDAALTREKDRWIVEGDPTEGALLVPALRAGLDCEPARSQRPRVADIALTSQRTQMSPLH